MQRKSSIDLISKYLQRTGGDKAPETQEYKRLLYNRLIKFLNGRNLNLDLTIQFLDSLTVTNRSKHGYLKYIRALTHWLHEEGYIETNWGTKIRLPKIDPKPDFPDLASELVEKIIIKGTEPDPIKPQKGGDTLSSIEIKKDTRDALKVMLRLGLRFQEVKRLRSEDLNFYTSPVLMKIRPSKGQGSRNISPSLDLIDMLKARCVNDKLFQITNEGCNRALARGVRKLNLKLNRKLTCHTLRHICATSLYRNGVPLPTIQKQLRHASYQTTVNNYLDLNVTDLADAVNSMPLVKNGVPVEKLIELAEMMVRKRFSDDSRLTIESKRTSNGLTLDIKINN